MAKAVRTYQDSIGRTRSCSQDVSGRIGAIGASGVSCRVRGPTGGGGARIVAVSLAPEELPL